MLTHVNPFLLVFSENCAVYHENTVLVMSGIWVIFDD